MDVNESLIEVDRLLSKINVNGDNVMLMALARQKLAEVYKNLTERASTDG